MQLIPPKLKNVSKDKVIFLNLIVDLHYEDEKIPELLRQFQKIFEEPTRLPPSRGHLVHRIPLQFGENLVNVRPYRCSLTQRDIIENLVGEMLKHGISQDSCSPFASPVVLVGKNNGSWRLCVDYNTLNNKKVKDKFPIPGR